MLQLTDNVRQELTKLVPASMLNDIVCFVFYDNHPRDQKHIDVIIATNNGELKEYYKRDLVNSLMLNGRYQPNVIKILRNGNCELFYLVIAGDELTLVSRKEKPVIHRRVLNVASYSLDDNVCRGQACLKVICNDEVIPMVFDENFDNLGDKALLLNGINADDSLPILTELKRKLTQTKFSVKSNESTLKEFLSLRQVSALTAYQKIHPSTESIFNTNTSKMDDVLILKSQTLWVKACDKKIVAMLTISYCNDQVPIEDVHILMHGTVKPTTVYTTKLYDRIKVSPFWKERPTNTILNDHDVAVVAVIDMAEVTINMYNTIQFHGVIAYRRLDKEYMVPFDEVIRPGMQLFGDQDVLASAVIDEMLFLPLVAVSYETKLDFRYLRQADDPPLVLPDTFANHMHMARIECAKNTIVFKSSPHHLMSGIMLVFQDNEVIDDKFSATAYLRYPGQVLTLLRAISDIMPVKMIVTTPRLRINSKLDKQWKFNEDALATISNLDYDEYASSMLKQTKVLLEYFDNCMTKMSESKDVEIKNKIGTEIDLFAGGRESYLEFRKNMLDLALNGVKTLKITEDTILGNTKTGSARMVTD